MRARFYLALILLLLLPLESQARPESSPDTDAWISLGVGGGAIPEPGGPENGSGALSLHAAFTYRKASWTYTVRHLTAVRLFDDGVQDVAVVFGPLLDLDGVYVVPALGPAWGRGMDQDCLFCESGQQWEHAWGVGAEVQIIPRSLPFLGFGLHANASSAYQFYGFSFSLRLGSLMRAR